MVAPVTAAMLYDLVACPHRVTMDLFADPAQRDEPNPFVELLWEKGSLYEREVIAGLQVPFLDLSPYAGDEKERLTLEAMQKGEALIYGGRIQVDGLLGDPDLLRKEGAAYVAGDIKSGSGEEGPEDNSKPKIHYAVQLGLYTDILERKRLSVGRRALCGIYTAQKCRTTSTHRMANAIRERYGRIMKMPYTRPRPSSKEASRPFRPSAPPASSATGIRLA